MKILFVGLGSIGQRHLRLVRQLRGDADHIIAFRSSKESNDIVLNDNMEVLHGESLRTRYNIDEYINLQTALAAKPDLTFITNPSSFHLDTAIAAAKAGSHLFIEKPLAVTTNGIEELIQIVNQKRLVALVGYQQRYHPIFTQVKSWLNDSRIGKVLSAYIESGEYLPDWHPYEDYRATHPARKELGGGVIFGVNHELDYVIDLFGFPSRVFASANQNSNLSVDSEHIAVVVSLFSVASGSIPITVHMDYLQRNRIKVGKILGSEGVITWDFYNNHTSLYDIGLNKCVEAWSDPNYSRNAMFIEQLRHLFACIESGASPRVPLSEAELSVKLGWHARQSIATLKVIET